MTIKDGFKDEVSKHWIWIVTMIFGVGTAFATLSVQQSNISATMAGLDKANERIVKTEKTDIELHAADMMVIARLDTIAVDIKELRNTVEKQDAKMNERITQMSDKTQAQFDELKKILYKPAIGTTLNHSNGSNSMAKVIESLLNK